MDDNDRRFVTALTYRADNPSEVFDLTASVEEPDADHDRDGEGEL